MRYTYRCKDCSRDTDDRRAVCSYCRPQRRFKYQDRAALGALAAGGVFIVGGLAYALLKR